MLREGRLSSCVHQCGSMDFTIKLRWKVKDINNYVLFLYHERYQAHLELFHYGVA
ncbi:unnamed protein product [Timema podura]|uniref:Uncharacterized protein n=1 Tax=Timema podura TaxID=61482 RepID=A0ABN7P9V8_TIMPD|nr:unnamed protein product [Timema podura]